MFKPLRLTLALALALLAPGAQAQSTLAPSASATSPAKKALIAKVLQIQQPGIEAMARQLAEQPAVQMLQQANIALQQRVPAERREAVAKDIQGDARKYVDEATAIVRARALELAPTTVGAVLDEKLTEDELKRVVAILESPAYRKFQSLAGDMQRTLGEKLVADTRVAVEPKLRTLEQSIVKRLEPPALPPAGASAPK